MKRIFAFLAVALVLLTTGCQSTSTEINITVPAGNTNEFIYTDQEISPKRDKFKMSIKEGASEAGAVLKTVQVKEKTEYEPFYLQRNIPTEVTAEKGGWFKIGIALNNSTDKDITVTLKLDGVNVRIE